MKYRINKKTGDKISELGFGTSCVVEKDEKSAVEILQKAYENGINFFDLATSQGNCFPYMGKALSQVRKDVIYQIHFGTNYETGA